MYKRKISMASVSGYNRRFPYRSLFLDNKPFSSTYAKNILNSVARYLNDRVYLYGFYGSDALDRMYLDIEEYLDTHFDLVFDETLREARNYVGGQDVIAFACNNKLVVLKIHSYFNVFKVDYVYKLTSRNTLRVTEKKNKEPVSERTMLLRKDKAKRFYYSKMRGYDPYKIKQERILETEFKKIKGTYKCL